MFLNGKLFLPPPQDGSDFKELFKRLAAAGAGRPLGSDGFPAGPWTPELLAEAISRIEPNGIGVDLRTVQLWFQENDKGISAANIRWLARVCGCDDPGATSQWQIELSAAQSKLTAKRRELKNAGAGVAGSVPELSTSASLVDQSGHSPEQDTDAKGAARRFGLAQRSEALFSRGSPLNLPASVFAGFTALGFLSYILGIHSVTHARADGVLKQVGFLWTANWTFVFMAFLPLFVAVVAELVTFWKQEGRVTLLPEVDRLESDDGWARNVESSAYSYWAVFLICVLFAGLLQWVGVCLVPLLEGGGNYAIDWGKIAIVRPEVISVPVAVAFTGFAYLYMCLCFYLFFVGFILLYTVAHDLWKIRRDSKHWSESVQQHDAFHKVGHRVMHAIFRCTILGLLIAIAMKLQSAYLLSRGEDIVAWLAGDASSAFYGHDNVDARMSYRSPTHYSSFLVALSACFVFVDASVRLGGRSSPRYTGYWAMSAVVAMLFAAYVLTDAFTGFSILLGLAALLGIFSLFDPRLGRSNVAESDQSVP
ncbi:hypothetical protein [Aminobacter sp. MDW-2]|uniref:RcgA family putative transporter n=1 Tax=Aminobacter sp. MDW-2 TaxID=2666139 RepID=UPI0012B09758|nr:hypothetical protein [Aminobacter sp. MDW-2]MRX36876.1 hypothetical protein [Aminobacter sp. MDW-2]QNH37902.1 hypothetical protein H5P29_31155 [Aminobacter sp. MDW-2]